MSDRSYDDHELALIIESLATGRSMRSVSKELCISWYAIRDIKRGALGGFILDLMRKYKVSQNAWRAETAKKSRNRYKLKTDNTRDLVDSGVSIAVAAKQCGVSVSTFYRNYPAYKNSRPLYHTPKLESLNGINKVVYFVKALEGEGLIKIGYATNLRNRMKALRGCCPVRTELALTIPAGPKLERVLHKRFSDCRAHNEWFRPSSKLISFIERTKNQTMCQPRK